MADNNNPETNIDDGEEILTGDLPSVNPPLPDLPTEENGAPVHKGTLSDSVLLKISDDGSAGTKELIVKSINTLEGLAAQKKALSAQEKQVYNKLKEHKVDAGPVKFVIKQRKLEMEYRNAWDMQVRMVRSAIGEPQLSLFAGEAVKEPQEEVTEKPVEKAKRGRPSLASATGNPAAKEAVLAKKGKGRMVKVKSSGNRPELH